MWAVDAAPATQMEVFQQKARIDPLLNWKTTVNGDIPEKPLLLDQDGKNKHVDGLNKFTNFIDSTASKVRRTTSCATPVL